MLNLSSFFSRFPTKRYYSVLFTCMGASFQLSMAATNGIYYLALISAVVFLLSDSGSQRLQNIKTIASQPLWIAISVWVGLLYISSLYSTAKPDLYADYLSKYVKYTLLIFWVYLLLAMYRLQLDLPRCFFRGFIIGGLLVFVLGVLNRATGWLNLAAANGWLPEKYLESGYWISNEVFAHSFFFSILLCYGLVEFFTKKHYGVGVGLIAVSVCEIFVVSEQRTGFIAVLVMCSWLLWLLLPTHKQKLFGSVLLLLIVALLLFTEQAVSQRVWLAVEQARQCFSYADDSPAELQQMGEACFNNIGLRLLFWHDALLQFKDSFIYGHGLANLDIHGVGYHWNEHYYFIDNSDNPHNEYLLQAVQLGIIGLLLLLFIFFQSFKQAVSIVKQRRLVYAGSVLMFAVACVFNSFLLDALQGLFFTLLVSFIIADSLNDGGENATIGINFGKK